MADGIKISALTEATDAQTVDGNLLETAVVDSSSSTGFSSKKTPISRLANYVLDKYTGLSLGGVTRTVKTAIDALKTATDALDTEMDTKADIDGEYDDLVVGTSKQLLSESYTLNRTPYKFRKSPYTDRLSESIVGASVAWNQLVQGINTSSGDGITTSYDTQTGLLTIKNDSRTSNYSSGSTRGIIVAPDKAIIGHKYAAITDKNITGVAVFPEQRQIPTIFAFNGSSDSINLRITFAYDFVSAHPIGDVTSLHLYIVDLTQMFGTTVADALYNMGDEGVKLFRSWYPSTYYEYSEPTLEHVSGLEAHDMVGFNQWDEIWEVGSLNTATGVSISDSSRIRSKNYIPVLPSTAYYLEDPTGNKSIKAFLYDGSKNFVRSTMWIGDEVFSTNQNEYYMRFIMARTYGIVYNHDICINLSDPTRNGQYKPYESHTYALDASLTLRGLIKYDATKGFYADGDVYEADGTVTRKYGIVDLGTLTWTRAANTSLAGGGLFQARVSDRRLGPIFGYMMSSKYDILSARGTSNIPSGTDKAIFTNQSASADVIYVIDSSYSDAESFKAAMSGVYLVYELATPTTESAEPYDAIQITDGTEEYVTACLVPVGHESKYYANLRSKIEGLPTDFSAIICATEATNKASRNYAVGDYLIYGNTLYKVTTAIATDATLTVGTNITATTIMAEIKALQ